MDAPINLFGRAAGRARRWLCDNMLGTYTVALGSKRVAGRFIFLNMCLLILVSVRVAS